MRPESGRCYECRRPVRERDRRDIEIPARRGEPAMAVAGGGCKWCYVDDDEARERNAYHEQRISEARESM